MKTFTTTLIALLVAIIFSCNPSESPTPFHDLPQSGAAYAMDHWAFSRAYPNDKIPTDKFEEAFMQKEAEIHFRDPENNNWESLGPKNIGGRTLCLAFHPTDTSILYVGSASGGLWKSTTNGRGVNAWQRVPTGFPALAVSAIEIDPTNPDIMYIGTGEVYSTLGNSAPGIVNRFTRGSYGIGILKTVDGGATWERIMEWEYNDLKGVQDLALNPFNPNTVYAATTEGLFRSHNAGMSWTNVSSLAMATDVLIDPSDTTTVFVAHGNLFIGGSTLPGIYRSTNGGDSFTELTNGLPASYSGKTLLDISPSNTDIIYASIQDFSVNGGTTPHGLFKTEDGGDSWTQVNNQNVALFQGWYSHDIAVKPDDPNTLIHVGVDSYKSTDGGQSLIKKTFWSLWQFGQVPVGGPEGPSNYAHADMHRAYYHPQFHDMVYLATDGGIFVSEDNGESWEGRNGGYQTTQFYANFGNSTTDSLLAIGGMQDNSTAIFVGDDAWVRVLGGDGLSAAINPENDSILFGSSQFLGLNRSVNRGQNFSGSTSGIPNENRAFGSPYEIAPSDPDIMYAGTVRLFKSTNQGSVWFPTTTTGIDGNNVIINIGVSPINADLVYVATAPDPFSPESPAKLFKTTDAGGAFTQLTGLPDRIISDIAFDPLDDNIVYVTLSGFNSDHVYKSEDGGENWVSIDSGLPNVPTSTIVVDPEFPLGIYIGNDIGVYFSPDGGDNWDLYSGDLPDAVMVMHLSLSPSNRKLRVATHGNGVYQADLVDLSVSTEPELEQATVQLKQNYPNPVSEMTTFKFELSEAAQVEMNLYDAKGRQVQQLFQQFLPAGIHTLEKDLGRLPAGVYYYSLFGKKRSGKGQFKESRILVKS